MIIEGQGYWVKILTPVPDYSKTKEEYTLDLALDEAAVQALTEAGLAHKIKPAVRESDGKEHAGGKPYIKFTVPTKSLKGELLTPPIVKDKFGGDWPKDDMIGNGSILRVRFDIREGTDFGGWRKPAMKAVQVWDHVPVEPAEDFDYAEAQPMGDEEAWEN